MKKIHQNVRRAILIFIDVLYPLFKNVMSLQTFRYAACGGINTFLDITLFSLSYNFILKKHNVHFAGLTMSPHIASLFMALFISLPTGFYLNRYVVFQQSGLRKRAQLSRYVLVVGISILLNFVFLKLFVDYLHWYPTISKIVTTVIVIVFSYISQTFYFFKQKPTVNAS
ncbi:GtrA family protein [Mucilaginibacter sp. X4EP1]|uniref:GtrA family protein n=1 Tax=Mucilaginibacter sp. X4EP1 TaxID=2723092 RepID=UPI0021677248|nr:GtrA family protein [Mucilaginibacter sp. X4EP1]MCS3813366.1 putative flippase GtrA [Mucilaginibacter sp. X4EP1]